MCAFVLLGLLQGEHTQNFFQKKKVLHTPAAKTGEFCPRLLCACCVLAVFAALSWLPPVPQGWLSVCLRKERL